MAGIDSLPLSEISAITPLDGRYRKSIQTLAPFVSEYALIKTRLEIEARYLIALSKIRIIRKLTKTEEKTLSAFPDNLSIQDILGVKKIEEEVRHDVKSAEKAFRDLIKNSSLKDITEMIHFGLTSEDINNLSYRLMLKRATLRINIPILEEIVSASITLAEKNKSLLMLARTHGQAAVPTTLGKELAVFAIRLQKEISKLKKNTLTGKLNGAVGNYNALHVVFQKVDWIKFSKDFLKNLGFEPNIFTTQINPYEDIIEYIQIYHRINSILIDLNQDMWRYISDNWFVQIAKKEEVGSSTLPQKVNPIDFENSEGNLQIANSLIEGFARKLPISRLQRDLSDSTTIRSVGTILGHSLMGYLSIQNGFSRVKPNKEQIDKDLYYDWSILTEGVQTILRFNKIPDSYSLIKNLSRGKHIGQNEWSEWISQLPVNNEIKKQLTKLTPKTYVGLAERLTEQAVMEIIKTKNNE